MRYELAAREERARGGPRTGGAGTQSRPTQRADRLNNQGELTEVGAQGWSSWKTNDASH